jgi:hypothetical protein
MLAERCWGLAVAAGIIGDAGVRAGFAALDVTAERRRAAVLFLRNSRRLRCLTDVRDDKMRHQIASREWVVSFAATGPANSPCPLPAFRMPATGTLMPSNSSESRPDVGFRINSVVAADWDELLWRILTRIRH